LFGAPIFSLQFGAVLNLLLLGALTWELVREAAASPALPQEQDGTLSVAA